MIDRAGSGCCAFALALCAATTSAQAPAVASAPASAGAEAGEQGQYAQLVNEAVGEYNSGAWSEARALFERAHALAPSARTLRGLGLCAFELRRYVDAIAELEAALADARQPLSPAQRDEVSAALARARRYVGQVRIEVEPAHATISIDGRIAQERALLLNVGEHRLGAKAAGHEPAALAFTVSGGQAQRVQLTLPPLADSDAGGDPGATQRLLGWSALGVAGAGIALGVIFELQRASTLRERDQICPSGVDCEPGSQSRIDRLSDQARTQGAVEVVGFVLGAVFAAGGASLLLSAPEAERANSRSAGLRLGMHGRGVSLTGSL